MSISEVVKDWNIWMYKLLFNNLCVKKHITLYDYNEFERVHNNEFHGDIYEAILRKFQKNVFLKTMPWSTLEDFLNRVTAYQELEKNKNILKFYGITVSDPSKFMLVLEYTNNGSLQKYLKDNFKNLNWNTKLSFAKQIASLIMYLHSKDIIHGSLSSKNIFVHNGNIKLNRLEISKNITEINNLTERLFQPNQYYDPKITKLISSLKHKKSLDIYSLGIILLEIFNGILDNLSQKIDLINYLLFKENIQSGISYELIKLCKDCLQPNETDRPSIQEIVNCLDKIDLKIKQNELISPAKRIKLENSKFCNNIESKDIEYKPMFVPIITRGDEFLFNLFDFFYNTLESQHLDLIKFIIKKYLKEINKNPAMLLYQLIKYPHRIYFTSLIGFLYQYGIGTSVDYQLALEYYLQAINEIIISSNKNSSVFPIEFLIRNNKSSGLILLGNLYLEGRGVKKNIHKAFHLFTKCAEEGSSRALVLIGFCYENNKIIAENKRRRQIFETYLKSAEQGNTTGFCKLGNCYLEGIGTEVDKSKGYNYCLESARRGNIVALHMLGRCYYNGDGVHRDVQKAFEYFMECTKFGFVDGQNDVAICYENGCGIEINKKESLKWYLISAENGKTESQRTLGNYYKDGTVTLRNMIKSIYWFQKAREGKDTYSSGILDEFIDSVDRIDPNS
ncbi:hypothetical protein Glove_673g25 [Diversispora epigaea]|uniref:Protein kinase domain-containing protein n=1 Tax=Diversispora epigaea TaxID=1348612 RepID=A0A397G793_9GLOM|nr:hypothetical protein Glove_673g25 [Diversispora epigaea]